MMKKKGISWKTVIPGLIMIIIILAIFLSGAIEPTKGGLGNLNDTLSEESVCGEYTSSGCCNNADGEICEDLREEWEKNDNKGNIEDVCRC